MYIAKILTLYILAKYATCHTRSYCTNYMTIFLLTRLTPGCRCRWPSLRNPHSHRAPDPHAQVLGYHPRSSSIGCDGTDTTARPTPHPTRLRHLHSQPPAVHTQRQQHHTRHSKLSRPVATSSSYQQIIDSASYSLLSTAPSFFLFLYAINPSSLGSTGPTDHTSAATLAFL